MSIPSPVWKILSAPVATDNRCRFIAALRIGRRFATTNTGNRGINAKSKGNVIAPQQVLHTAGEDMSLQYQMSLSALQDLDYTKAITEMSQKTLQLEAAQLSFKQTSQLSLFSIL